MGSLLIELGTEELPASEVRRAYTQLSAKIVADLTKESLIESEMPPTSMGTPRRLIIHLTGIRNAQADAVKEVRGPAIKSAFDAAGNPTPALLGFCRAQNVELADLKRDNQYLWISKQVPGRQTEAILAEIVPNAIRSITFDKTMRWGAGKMRFARPIRWILATFNEQLVSFELESVHSGTRSRGHRFYAPEPFEALNFEQLVDGLRSRQVEPDPDRRRAAILDHLPVTDHDRPQISESLLDENVFLTEWPAPIAGRFSERFLDLPASVLTTVMAKHEKMFPVLDPGGSLTSKFLFCRNSGRDDSVRRGCEWVLNARMNDAKFFFDEDARVKLEDFLERTKAIVFQEKLGTTFDRAHRIAALAAEDTEPDSERDLARLAGLYSKADLATGLVGELPSLQGVIGGIYARRSGLPEPVCFAIASQYEAPKTAAPDSVADRTAVRLLVADQIDKLAGYLGLGMEPSGSSDPYGLRRSVSMLIESAWSWPGPMSPYVHKFDSSLAAYESAGIELNRGGATAALCRLFQARYSHLMPQVRRDVLAAAVAAASAAQITSPKGVRSRIGILQHFQESESFVQAATRPINILRAAQKKGEPFVSTGELTEVQVAQAQSESAMELYRVATSIRAPLERAVVEEDFEVGAAMLGELGAPIHEFFEQTMVMADESETRAARLSVVRFVADLLLQIGDWTQIVFAGEA